MDRSKLLAKRPVKTKGHAPPGDFIALGSKTRTTSDAEPKAISSQPRKGLPGSTSLGTKRDAPSVSGASLVAKKPKLIGQTYTPLGRLSELDRRGSPTIQVYLYEEIAKEVEPHEFLDAVNEAEDINDDEKVEALLCGAIKYLKMNRAKPDPVIFLALMYFARTRPSFFGSEVVIEAFCSLLKRDVSINFKAKGNALVSVLACNILVAAFQDEENWPDTFVKVYIEDSLGERVWVDRTDCKPFIENIQSAFNTKLPKASLLQDTLRADQPSPAGGSPLHFLSTGDDDEKSLESWENFGKSSPDEDISSLVFPRYTYQQVSIETHVMDVIREQLTRRQSMDGGSRNLLRMMAVACGYSEVRTMCAQRLEMWLQNPKLTRVAQDLLMSICMNCDQHTPQDVEVMSQLAKIRLKIKLLITHYLLCMKELLSQHPDNLRTLMLHIVYNELSTSRNPNNMALLSVMFQYDSQQAARVLSEIFQDLLASRDDYLKSLRILLREIVRSIRHEMNFVEFCLGLMQERNEPKFWDLEPAVKERLFFSLADLVTLTQLVTVTPAVREAASAVARGDQKDIEVLRSFQTQISVIQRDAVWWMHTVVTKMFAPKAGDYIFCLKKLVFIEKPESYYKVDNWPPEGDRGLLLRLVSEVPVMEDTLMRVLVMGLTRDLHVSANDAIDLADLLIRRASVLNADDFPVLQIERLELIDAVLNLCAYRHPENITLPKGYQPPTLAISTLYWKAWIILLVMCAFNPSTFGRAACENYPMLKCFMEMTMTSNYRFPPLTMASDEKTVEEIRSQEKQIAELEKQEILEFESHLAAATSKVQITDATSLLISQLNRMDPSGVPRKPPAMVVEQLMSLNKTLRIGHMLCRSRNPDFLLDVIQRQGTSKSMPWLAELVESNESSLDVLPVQCLCEFLLLDTGADSGKDDDEEDDNKAENYKQKQKQKKQEQLLGRLQSLLHSPSSDSRTICEVLSYFLKRLASQQSSNRQLAVKGLSMVLSKTHLDMSHFDLGGDEESEEEEMNISRSPAADSLPNHRWLLEQLPSIPQFDAVKQEACLALRQSCQVETNASAVSAYIIFLSDYTRELQLQEQDELMLDLAQLIVERTTLITHLLPQDGASNTNKDQAHIVLTSMIDLYYNYLRKAQEPQKEAYSWSNTQDQILLQWKSEETATMNILVVHAMIILLTYGRPKGNSAFEQLLETWFPKEGHPPSAYLIDTSEEALLLPDWLKLRMIRSTNDRLVDAALQDLEPAQLLLFVQSFGIPVASMSKLLGFLDKAVVLNSYAMEQQVFDKSYMAQLVEVQHMRGATGGNQFKDMLLHEADKPDTDMDTETWHPSKRKRTPSQLTRAQEIPASYCTDVKYLQDILLQIFVDDVVTHPSRQQTFRAVQKSLAKTGVVGSMLAAFDELLRSKRSASLVKGLQLHAHLSCPLLRLLIAKQGDASGELLSLMEKLSQVLDRNQSALTVLVTDYLKKCRGQSPLEVAKGQAKLAHTHNMPPQQFMTQVAVASDNGVVGYPEDSVNQYLINSMQENQNVKSTRVVGELIGNSKPGLMPASTAGLLVDWLGLLDPEVVSSCPDMQQLLVFAKKILTDAADAADTAEKSSPSCAQPYLLALLTHQSSWRILCRCIQTLLSDTKHRYDPTVALDFLWACLHIPKIWQGREKVVPKNYSPEDVLGLTSVQVCAVVRFILHEAELSTGLNCQKETVAEVMSSRMPLLIRCCNDNRLLVLEVVKYLQEELKINKGNNSLCQHLLLEVYLHVPYVLGMVGGLPALNTDLHAAQKSINQLDSITHRLISTLGSAAHGKSTENKMCDANIACRKLASEHPTLLLRQLPMIAALLQGRAQFTFGEMRHRNHLLLYSHILGILEILRPYLFLPNYTEALRQTFKSYFELIKIHGFKGRGLASIINKFIRLLHNYLSQDAPRACQVLYEYVPVLNGLTNNYPDFSALRSLLAGLTLPRQDRFEQKEETTPDTLTIVPARPSSPWTVGQLAPFLNKIAKGSSPEDVLEVLKDLDETSKRKLDILAHFVGDLKRLMTCRNETCRNLAFTLAMRHIRQSPSCAKDFVSTYIRCLDSKDYGVVNSALGTLAEFTLLARENGSKLLQKAFIAGMAGKVDSGAALSESLQLLNMETMV